MIPTSNTFVTIIFSKDRPMQLDLTLSTNARHCSEKNARNEIVIYKTSNNDFENAYQQVANEHPAVQFLKEDSFKDNLLECINKKRYVMFVVDDCIFTRAYSINRIASFLDICDGVLGFSLRLGKNTDVCYPIREKNDIPYILMLSKEIGAFSWRQAGKGDFSYPLELSSSVYRVKDLKPLLEGLNYNTPNSLEWLLSNSTHVFNYLQFLLCYETSPAFCNPINKVQTENNNRVGTKPEYSIENLLKLYRDGHRINPESFDGFISNGAHMETELTFK
jgi:hypothetical protein